MVTLNTMENRKLSRSQAEAIANSMYDLGTAQKEKVAFILGGKEKPGLNDTVYQTSLDRFKAFTDLDKTTKLVLEMILVQNPLDEVLIDFDYMIAVLTRTKNAINSLVKQK